MKRAGTAGNWLSDLNARRIKREKNKINKWVTSVSADNQFLIPSLKSLSVSVGLSERGYSVSEQAERGEVS